VRQLNGGLLPPRFRTFPQVHLGTRIESDVTFSDPEVFEVRIFAEGRRIVSAIELVSPANKDRPEHRRALTSKCVAHLHQQVGLLVVDIVTEPHANLHEELLELLAQDTPEGDWPDLYAVAYRTRQDGAQSHLEVWPAALALGVALPTLPLWLGSDFAVSIDLESSYLETGQVLRIE
jgi:hypothetical protein